MSWIAVHYLTDSANAESLSDLLFELGALSVTVEDALEGTDEEEPIFGEPGEPLSALWKQSAVTALFAEETEIDPILQEIEQTHGFICDHTEIIADTDWVRATQSQFDPIQISKRLWITPSWHELPDPQAVNLILDPGLAFGTGSHPTTRLCLQWLDANPLSGKTILDYGCGSGILAIAAMKLGAHSAEGIDIDPQAMIASQQNAEQNNVGVRFALPDAASQQQYDIVVANILTNPLKTLAPLLAKFCRPKGEIILSGILAEQVEDVLAIYQQWFDIQLANTDEGWALIHGTRLAT
jgi:ribosomal protein L11 methyltransferase